LCLHTDLSGFSSVPFLDPSFRTAFILEGCWAVSHATRHASPHHALGGLALATMNNVLVLVCITLLFLVSSAQKQPKTAYEISVGNLTANLDAWDVDVAVMFYAPWCKYCKQLLPTWESIAQLAKPNKNLVVTTFDCEADDNVETCQLLKVDRYPTIAFLGYGDLHQAPKSGNVFGKVRNAEQQCM
jgi:thiol-disulfide isomerase/thioredoxin